MEKRYQIFISSTFVDLRDERQAVLKAILELDHMPAGMELFPATDNSAWQLITDVIDSSDYYVLIVGGRYGSLDEAGLSYTEKEYDYALATRKPVIPLLHENPDNLPRDKTETDSAVWEKLKAFRAKVEKKHTCVYWRNADDLKAKVIVGLTAVTKRYPAVGWVRADSVPTEATITEVLALKNRIAELEQQAAALRDRPPAGTEALAQGDDHFELHLSFVARKEFSSYPRLEDQDLHRIHHTYLEHDLWGSGADDDQRGIRSRASPNVQRFSETRIVESVPEPQRVQRQAASRLLLPSRRNRDMHGSAACTGTDKRERQKEKR
jgi:hypothetical protein